MQTMEEERSRASVPADQHPFLLMDSIILKFLHVHVHVCVNLVTTST